MTEKEKEILESSMKANKEKLESLKKACDEAMESGNLKDLAKVYAELMKEAEKQNAIADACRKRIQELTAS